MELSSSVLLLVGAKQIMRVTFLPLELNRAVMIPSDTGKQSIKAFATGLLTIKPTPSV